MANVFEFWISVSFLFNSFRIRRIWVKKVKCTLVQALRLCTGRTAHREIEVYLYPFLTTALEGGEGSASRLGHSLPPGTTRHPLYRSLRRLKSRSGQVRKTLPPTGIRSPDGTARSQSLYRLSYSARVEYDDTSSNFAPILICDLCVINLWFPLFTVQKWIICVEECSLLVTRTISSTLSLPLQ
jgi:hypothetical protein